MFHTVADILTFGVLFPGTKAVLSLFQWIVFWPDQVPYASMGPIGSFVQYLVKQHFTAMYYGCVSTTSLQLLFILHPENLTNGYMLYFNSKMASEPLLILFLQLPPKFIAIRGLVS